jgi:hypothetical protein
LAPRAAGAPEVPNISADTAADGQTVMTPGRTQAAYVMALTQRDGLAAGQVCDTTCT